MKRKIESLIAQVRDKYRPEKIILFGSCARGDYDEYSDVDMLIVKDTDRRFLDRIGDVLYACDYDVLFEPLVYTPQEIDEMRHWNFFIQTILDEGKVVYEAKQ